MLFPSAIVLKPKLMEILVSAALPFETPTQPALNFAGFDITCIATQSGDVSILH